MFDPAIPKNSAHYLQKDEHRRRVDFMVPWFILVDRLLAPGHTSMMFHVVPGYSMSFCPVITFMSTYSSSDQELVQTKEYLAQCGLPRRALREIWQVANPHLKSCLGVEEFRASCRLVGHCQAWPHEACDRVCR